jgi:hypothetical protein
LPASIAAQFLKISIVWMSVKNVAINICVEVNVHSFLTDGLEGKSTGTEMSPALSKTRGWVLDR